MQAHFEEIKMKLTKLTTLLSAMILAFSMSSLSLASAHDDDNPNTSSMIDVCITQHQK